MRFSLLPHCCHNVVYRLNIRSFVYFFLLCWWFFCLSIHFLFVSLPHSDQKTSHQTKGNGNGFTIMKCLILILYTIEATEANTENKHLCGNLQFVLVWLLSDFRNDCALIIAIIYQRQFTRGWNILDWNDWSPHIYRTQFYYRMTNKNRTEKNSIKKTPTEDKMNIYTAYSSYGVNSSSNLILLFSLRNIYLYIFVHILWNSYCQSVKNNNQKWWSSFYWMEIEITIANWSSLLSCVWKTNTQPTFGRKTLGLE